MDRQSENMSHSWYALRVRSRFEKTVAAHLDGRGYASFVPLYKCRRRWSDRFKVMEYTLFPGYVFCRFNPLNRLPVLSIPGVVCLVGVGSTPLAVDETEMASIQAVVTSGLPSRPWPFLQVGQKVRIEYGPLSGVEGILLDFRGQQRLVLSVSLVQGSVAVQVDGACVQPLHIERHVSDGLPRRGLRDGLSSGEIRVSSPPAA